MTEPRASARSAWEEAVLTIRFLSTDAVEKAQSGHPGTPMALAGIAVDIYTRYLRWVPEAPAWPNRDRFVLSCGHASMLLYSLLYLSGYGLELDELRAFRQWDSRTPGHPEHGLTPGVETTTGPLGQGFGNAVGMALASKLMAARVNAPGSTLIDYRVFVLASDGDLMEGVASEAASLAGKLGLENLIVVYDDNRITIDGSTDLSFSEDVGKRFEAYGWHVDHVNGHAPDEVRAALDRAVAETERPSLIVARTHIAIGAPTKQDSAEAHGSPLGKQEVEAAKRAAGWPVEPTFFVPDGARELFLARAAENRTVREQWQQRLDALDPERKELYQRLSSREVPGGLLEELVKAVGDKADATRSHSSKALAKIAELVPSLVGGSADLAGSVKTSLKGAGDVAKKNFAGKNIHFGVREHAMGAICNGLALSGFFIPYGSTFLIFSDYMRPSVRLAALMEQKVVLVYSHDSVFLGEDGPTHQPIEQLWSLRLIPNLSVFRPADALETAAAWTYALSRQHGPTAIVLSRQKVPALERPKGFDPATVLDGGYVIADVDRPELVLMATGSEVGVAVAAQKRILAQGRRVRVVSLPCVEVFEALPETKKQKILPPGIRRAALEAGRSTAWRTLVGLDGIVIGIDRFGASAPWEVLAEKFGLTAEAVAARLLDLFSDARQS